ncbi:MAG: cadherin-like domain-containing protein [Parvularculaceae bacterium]|nr:cadherin-like domain-containing protein [Parvularculaceae bacterium]
MTPLASHHMAGLKNLDALAPVNTGVKAVRSGPWSDARTWGGRIPKGRIIIPKGVDVVFDLANSPTINSIRIEGCLELSSRSNSRLNAEFIYVAPGGELLAGSPNAPIAPSVTAEVVFPDLGPLDPKIDPTLTGKGLVAASRVRLYGALKTPRAKVASAPKKGDSVIRLSQAPNGWRIGDRVVLTGTRFIPQKKKRGVVVSSNTEDEARFIRAIRGADITLDKPLTFDHGAPDPSLGAYLVNFSRNIRFATQNGANLPASRRAHSMYMSTETTVQGVEFFEMGRTDKSVRALDADKLSPPTPTSNVKGRYPLHLHQAGFVSDNAAPVVRNVAVWGSPGWGIAQHAGNAFLYQNNTFNTFGAAFVSESGNETGAWVGNTAIKTVGVAHLLKNGGDVRAFDLARTGDAYWLQSRSVRLHDNLAAGLPGGVGFVYFHRNNDLGSRFPISPSFARANFCTPAAMRFRPQSIDKPAIAQFTDNEVIAAKEGFHVVKASPIEPHDIRSVIDNFRAWEVKTGVWLTYTSRYTVKNSLLIGASSQSGTLGVKFGKNTYDLAVVNTTIENFSFGVDLSKVTTRTFGKTSAYTLAGVNFRNIANVKTLAQDASDQIFTRTPSTKSASLKFNWGGGPAYLGARGVFLLVQGVKSDSSGTTPYPVSTTEFRLNGANFKNMIRDRGWHTLTNGRRATVVPEFYSDRLTGEIFQTSFIAVPPARYRWPSQLVDGSSADQGRLDPKAPAPTARDDSASVSRNGKATIAVLSNDRSNDGGMTPSGYTYPRNGNVTQLANGSFVYEPFPDFSGSDSFTYWVRNRQGVVARATVNVSVR